jgi:UDP-GlcNAc:undecaprenyl-phosphate GlcNAc-1-phosphate transferase
MGLLFCISLLTSIILIKILIKISIVKKIFDSPNDIRKLHTIPTPNIGGIAIFFTILFSLLFFPNFFAHFERVNFLLASNVLLFLFGLHDDLVGLSPSKRFFAQLVAGMILIFFGDFRISNLSLIGLSSISYPLSIIISILFYVFITNAYNLIDGINGLLGSFAILSCLCFAIIFFNSTDVFLIAILISMIGAILGFLIYNFGDASIFMGSSGSYIIGALMYFYSIYFINVSNPVSNVIPRFPFLFSFLAIPLFDTLRVFFLRTINRKSPFKADSNHIHHRLLKLNISHSNTVLVMVMANISLILLNASIKNILEIKILIIDFIVLIFFNVMLEFYITKIKKIHNK